MVERNIYVQFAHLWVEHPEVQAMQVHVLVKGIPDQGLNRLCRSGRWLV